MSTTGARDVVPDGGDVSPDPAHPPPDGAVEANGAAEAQSIRVGSSATIALLVIALLYVSSLAAPVLIPVVLAAMLKVMLSPLVELLGRIGVPRAISALVIVAALPLLTGYAVIQLTAPVSTWFDEAPAVLDRIEQHLMTVTAPLKDIKKAATFVEGLATIPSDEPAMDEVEVATPDTIDRVTAALPGFLLGLTVTVFVTFFLLASGDRFLRKLASAGSSFAERRQIVEATQRVQNEVGTYLRTIFVINVGLGCATAAVLWWIGVANPVMWGTIAALANFAPYVGALVVGAALTLTGLATYDTLPSALLPPAIYLLLTTVEGQLITPAVLGHRMSMSPLVVFMGVIAAGALWGFAGALVAVPVLVTIKIVCEHVEPVRIVAVLMGR